MLFEHRSFDPRRSLLFLSSEKQVRDILRLAWLRIAGSCSGYSRAEEESRDPQ
jgi:hypothetical protein